jgi:signal transduction histidine kinase
MGADTNPRTDLRDISVLADLDDEELAQVAQAGREVRLAAGEFLFHQGERPTALHLVLEGRLETTREVAGEQVHMMIHGPGGFLGAMALLTETTYRGTTFAVADTVLFELDGDDLRRLAFSHPAMLRRFLPAFESVSHAVKGIERDREKLLAVGRLAAGLAHELNNPAAAAARAVPTLRDHEHERQAAFAALTAGGADLESIAALAALGAEATAAPLPATRLDPLAESDREQDLADALDRRGVVEADAIAGALTEGRLGPEWIDRVAAAVGEDALSAGLRFVAACGGARVVLAELEQATTRISDLVGAVRDYSYLDQGPRQTVDVNAGIERTLALLDHRVREQAVEIVRDLDPALPTIEGSGQELNQTWTNLLDNALDAVGAGGRITVRTGTKGPRIAVEIADDGPGIPEDLQARVFDPFFTTKAVGRGTGLGLDIVQRIVVRHHGEVLLASRPGETRFEVLLPPG